MQNDPQEVSSKFHPLPCLFTIASLFCGFYAILACIKGDFVIAATAIVIAAVFDGLDGRVARLTGTTSTFGMELDSLCDMVSFGVAPGLLAYFWALEPFGRYGWLAAFLYVATTCLRLARFNSQQTSDDGPSNFVGLPCPAAAGMISSSVLFSSFLGIENSVNHISVLIMVYVLSYLMVSNHTYLSFKKTNQKKSRTFQLIVASLLLFILVAAEPKLMLFALGVTYTLSGPLLGAYKKLQTVIKHKDNKSVHSQ